MMIEVWKDAEGFRLSIENEDYEFTNEGYEVFADFVRDSVTLDPDRDNYRVIHVDLPEEE